MIRSSIDLGTNTCLLLVASCDPAGPAIQEVLGDYVTLVRLGEGVDQAKALQPLAMERTLQCLRTYAETVKKFGGDPHQTICVATSQARDSANAAEFFDQIKAQTGFSFRVISGDQEALLTFKGALNPGVDPRGYGVVDIGGGSTELITDDQAMSLDVGSVRFTERYLGSDPVTQNEYEECLKTIEETLVKGGLSAFTSGRVKNWVGVAGTATTLASWKLGLNEFNAQALESSVLTTQDLEQMVFELKALSISERRKLPGMEPMRADVILAGAMILWRILKILEVDQLQISIRGLRFGALWLDSN